MKAIITVLFASSIVFAIAAQQGGDSCCKDKAKGAAQCQDKTAMNSEAAFLAEAQKMAMQAEGKESCCKSTEAKAVAKGDKGCCNEKGVKAAFKVFVAGTGYQFFGCPDSAAKARTKLVAEGKKVGTVQKVTDKATVIS